MPDALFAPGDSGLGAKADAMIELFRIRHVADSKAGTCRTDSRSWSTSRWRS